MGPLSAVAAAKRAEAAKLRATVPELQAAARGAQTAAQHVAGVMAANLMEKLPEATQAVREAAVRSAQNGMELVESFRHQAIVAGARAELLLEFAAELEAMELAPADDAAAA